MPLTTDRLALPLLAAAQAQKEMIHNEALTMLDASVQPVVVAVAPTSIPVSPAPGQCWIVGSGAAGAWAGHDGALATWTAGGWRFVAPFEGMQAWDIADSTVVRREGSSWKIGALKGRQLLLDGQQVVGARLGAIAAPAQGTTIDAEARDAITAVLVAMRSHGLIAS